jgi:hypothetical protein
MKKRNALGIISLTLVFFMSLAGCQQPEELSSDATLTSITVAGVEVVSLGTPSEDWQEAVENSGSVYLSAAGFINAEVSASASADGAKVFFSQVKPGVLPNFVEETVFSFAANDLLFVEVFSANLDKFLIYAIRLQKTTPVISDIRLAGRSATGGAQLSGIPIQQFGTGMGTPGSSWNDPAIVEGSVWFGTSQIGTSVSLSIEPEAPGTTFQYAVVANGFTDPTGLFADPSDPISVTPVNGSYLYIKSVSDNTEYGETVYYKVKMEVKKDDRSLQSVTINGVSFSIGQMGTHSFPGSEAWGAYSNGAELATDGSGYKDINTTLATKGNPVDVAVVPTDTSLDILYGHTTVERNYEVEFGENTNLGVIPTNDFIALEVRSELGEKGWYKFRVGIGRPGAELNVITISGGVGAVAIPAANTAVTGVTASEYRMSSAGPWSPTVTTTVSEAAGKAYAVAATISDNITDWSNTTGALANVVSAQYVVIRVVSESTRYTNYYKIRLAYGNSGATLSTLSVGSVSAAIGTAADVVYAEPAEDIRGAITLAPAQLAGAVVSTLDSDPANTGAMVDCARGYIVPGFDWKGNPIYTWTVSDYTSAAVPADIQNGEYLVVRVTSEDRTVIRYHYIKVTITE